MLDYTGIPCPVCGKEFKENDDIVVCPQCGAPYHRNCYNEKGSCIFDELHEKGETWAPPEIEKPEPPKDNVYEIKDKECPRCGVLNAHSALFCSNCNAPLTGEPDTHENRPPQQQPPMGNVPPAYNNMYGVPIMMDPLGGVKPTDTVDNNITYGEVSKVVQQNTRYYIPIFNRIKLINKSKFNFSAFFFSGGWFLYRKMYKPGIIMSVLMFLFYIGEQFLNIFVTYPAITPMFQAAGVDLNTQLYLTGEQYNLIAQQMMEKPEVVLLVLLPLICKLCMLAIMIFAGITANKMYMKHCVKTIKTTRDTSNNIEEFESTINEKGGVNTSLAVCMMICYFICSYLPTMLMI